MRNKRMSRSTWSLVVASLCALHTLIPQDAAAFCGMYVSSKTDEKLLNEATHVVLFREDTTTSVTMQNQYKGPVEDFAMLVPVPEVLQKKDVQIVAPQILDDLALYTMPRSSYYKQSAQCPRRAKKFSSRPSRGGDLLSKVDENRPMPSSHRVEPVKVKERFSVDEYDIVVLEATESTGLLKWLRARDYNIPDGGEELLQGYINTGMYFFVAKVDASKVKFNEEGEAMLSPLKFTYESEDFSLPVRLGMLNADGPQELLIHVISKEGRFEAKNYKTGVIPTNLIVDKEVQQNFASFYSSLFAHSLLSQEAQLLTEYVGQAFWQKCDPCTSSVGTLQPQTLKDVSNLVEYPSQWKLESTLAVHVDKLTADSALWRESFEEGMRMRMDLCVKRQFESTLSMALQSPGNQSIKDSYQYAHSCKLIDVGQGAWRAHCDPIDFHLSDLKGAPRQERGQRLCLETSMEELAASTPFTAQNPEAVFVRFEHVSSDLSREGKWVQRLNSSQYMLTRLHARFSPGVVSEDLVFAKADGLIGGYGSPNPETLEMSSFYETNSQNRNQFQARYMSIEELSASEREALRCDDSELRYFWNTTSRALPPIQDMAGEKPVFGKNELKALIKNAEEAKLNL